MKPCLFTSKSFPGFFRFIQQMGMAVLLLAMVVDLTMGGLTVGGLMAGDSLWVNARNNERGMYADKRAGTVGDILTVAIDESITMTVASSTQTDKSSSIVKDFAKLLFEDTVLSGTVNGQTASTDLSGTDSYDAGGTISNTQTVRGTISVLVLDTLPNGNLILEGVRSVAYSGETYFVVLRGLCRPQDVDSDNQISSNRIAGARIEIISEGSLTDVQRKGWLTRLNDLLNPF